MRGAKIFFKYLLALFFVLAGLNHFRIPGFYTNIMPDYIPGHLFMVYLSGVTEVAAGMMLAIPPLSRWGAWFIITHLAAFLTVHFWMIQEKERYLSENVTIELLWLRIVAQVVLIVWAYWFTTGPAPGKSSR